VWPYAWQCLRCGISLDFLKGFYFHLTAQNTANLKYFVRVFTRTERQYNHIKWFSPSPFGFIRRIYYFKSSLVCYLLGVSPASGFYSPTFRNFLSVPSSRQMISKSSDLKIEQIESSETSANKNQTPGKHPKDSTLNIKHGEILKSRIKSSFFEVADYSARVARVVQIACHNCE
jgi:hypothetical protein